VEKRFWFCRRRKDYPLAYSILRWGLHWNGINSWEASWLKKHSLPKKTLNFSLNFLKTLQQDLNMP
jgi:hypothetical protein